MRSLFSLVFVSLCSMLAVTSCHKKDEVNYQTVDFESLVVPAAGYWNGSDAKGSFTATNMKFNNEYNSAWKSWNGFSYSQKNDVTTAGFENEFSVIDPANKTNTFAVFYPAFGGDLFAQFADNNDFAIQSIDLCNSTYAGLTLKNGNAFCKKFGGTSGTDPDWFKVTISGYDHSNNKVGTKEVYLADYRSGETTKDYIVTKWTTVDLSSLGKVNKITFAFTSSDTGAYGINTPTYVCLDNIKYLDDSVVL
jgi:hypothetical protein